MDGVKVLFPCTSSDGGLHLYKVSRKYSRWYQSYRADMIFIGKISKGHNSVKNVYGIRVLFFFFFFSFWN